MSADDLIYSRADFDTAVAAATQRGRAEAQAEADTAMAAALKPYEGKTAEELRADGANAERERLSGVMTIDEAKGREGPALKLALLTPAMTAETAKAVFAELPQTSSMASRRTEVPHVAGGPATPDKQAEIEQGYGDIAARLNRQHGLKASA